MKSLSASGCVNAGHKALPVLIEVVFILVVFAPILALIAATGRYLWAGNTDALALAIPTGRRLELLSQSLGLATAVAAAALTLAIAAGTWLWRWRSGWGVYLRWLSLALVATPPYVHALAWVTAVDAINGLLRGLGLPSLVFQGWLAAWWVQTLALAPLALGLTLLGLESVDRRLIEAARVLRPDLPALVKIVLPLAMPFILAGGGFVFLLSLTDYSVPSLFQVNVYALEIFAEYSAANIPARAFLLALPLLLIAVAVVAVSQSKLRRAVLQPLSHIRPWPAAFVWPAWMACSQRAGMTILAAQILVPLIGLSAVVATWDNLTATLASARSEIGFSFRIASLAALICLPLALVAANRLLRPTIWGRLWWLLVTLPLAVPAPLVGIGLIAIWNRPDLPATYDSELMPILAVLARFTSLAALVLLAQLRRIDPLLLDAARVLRPNGVRTWLQIRLPMLAPGLVAAACVVFALSAGELGATLLVIPPGQASLTLRIYSYLHYGASETVAGLCLLMTLLTLIAGLFALLVLRGWLRLFPRLMARWP